MKIIISHLIMPVLMIVLSFIIAISNNNCCANSEGLLTVFWIVDLIVFILGVSALFNGALASLTGNRIKPRGGREMWYAHTCPHCWHQFGGKQYRQGVNFGLATCSNCGQPSKFENKSTFEWFISLLQFGI